MMKADKKTSSGRATRRDFLKSSTVGAASLGAVSGLIRSSNAEGAIYGNTADNGFDFQVGSSALKPDRVVKTACQFCNSLCGLEAHVKAGRVIELRGVEEDPVQAGQICVKGPMMLELVYNRHRLTQPLMRVGGAKGDPDSKFEPVSWDEALSRIARKFLELRDQGEARAIANKTSGRLPRGTGSLVARYFELLGSPNNTDVGPVCNDAGGNALSWTFGLPNFTNGYGIDGATGKEDLGSAELFLFLGTNQAETHPVTFSYLLRERQRRRSKLVVVDPRKTPTAEFADEWIAPKPHTDLALVLGILYHIIDCGWENRRFVRKWVLGFEELKRHLKTEGYTPEWAASVTDVSVEQIKNLARLYAKSKPAAIFCNAGISHQLGAFDTYRVLAFLASITGNIGRLGGGCNFMHNTWPGGLHLPQVQSPTPTRDHALPVGPDAFADAILKGDPYPLKALVTQGNPLLASSNNDKVRAAYKDLEFYVYTGLFMEESAYYADVILPVTSGLEMETVYMRRDDRAIRWQEKVVDPVGKSKPDWWIWIELAHATAKFDTQNSPEYWTREFPQQWKDYQNLWSEFVKNTPGMGGMTVERMRGMSEPLRYPCPDEKHPGVSALYLDHPSWDKAVESLDPAAIGKRFLTPSGKVEIYTEELETKLRAAGHGALPVFYTHPDVTGGHPVLKRKGPWIQNPVNPQSVTRQVVWDEQVSGALSQEFPLMGMTGRPSVAHFHSVTHWTPTGKQLNGIRLIQMHPEAARAAGIQDGVEMVVESPLGSVTGTAQVVNGIREDTIFVPNWFGPLQLVADDLRTPKYDPVSRLISDEHFDNLSGQQAFKCFACRVRRADAGE